MPSLYFGHTQLENFLHEHLYSCHHLLCIVVTTTVLVVVLLCIKPQVRAITLRSKMGGTAG